jgi:putative ABC transport system ATP-binding protein
LLDTLTIEENILLALTMQDDVKVLDPASASRIAADQTKTPQIETAWPAESRDASPGHSPAKRNRADSSLSKRNCPDQTSEGRRLGRKQKITHNCNEILRLLGIEDIREKFPYQVSGGQKQRCACARALVNQPKLLLADEPTGALDSKAAQTLLETFTDLNRAMNATILMVTHDAFSASYCGRILFLKDGRIFHELIRGSKSRKAFLQEILDVLSLTGGRQEVSDVK